MMEIRYVRDKEQQDERRGGQSVTRDGLMVGERGGFGVDYDSG